MVGGAIYRGLEIPVKNKLKILRAERNLTQTALGELVRVSRQTINAIERGGSRQPRIDTLSKLSEVLEVPISELAAAAYDDQGAVPA